jgi:hypothetical protein
MALISPKKRNMAINVNTAACGSFIPSTPDRQAACTPARVPTAPAEKHVGAGVATAHWPLATDDDEPAAMCCHGAPQHSWPRTSGPEARRMGTGAQPRLRPVADDLITVGGGGLQKLKKAARLSTC